jgi:hypothetical protein
LRGEAAALASVAVEGPVFDGSRSARNAVASWREIAGAMETILRAQPALCASPFAHLHPDAIVL